MVTRKIERVGPQSVAYTRVFVNAILKPLLVCPESAPVVDFCVLSYGFTPYGICQSSVFESPGFFGRDLIKKTIYFKREFQLLQSQFGKTIATVQHKDNWTAHILHIFFKLCIVFIFSKLVKFGNFKSQIPYHNLILNKIRTCV